MKKTTNLHDLLAMMPEEDPRTLSRRRMLAGSAGAATAALFGGPMLQNAAAAPKGTKRTLRTRGQALPEDAAPVEKQVFIQPANNTIAKAFDFYEAVYERVEPVADLFSDPLVRIDRNFEILPGGAESWEGSEDGMTWTFKIRQGNTWSDGNPVTAADWVKTFQYAADPEHAWDFTWFWDSQGKILNW
ncbi:MAG: ABC transporter substrate-binding protein, partial [Chloroflexota bacterium]|nr:ABC transporter substrate-binding protein [Chloroflexota bacterium]